MTRFVDPFPDDEKDGPVFVYPPLHEIARYELNSASDEHWETKNGRYPFVLTAKGRAEPREAIERLFRTYPDELDTRHDSYQPDADHRNMLV
jgi:hypothetical protein